MERLLAARAANRGYEAQLASHRQLREELIVSATEALQRADAELAALVAHAASAGDALAQQQHELRKVRDVGESAHAVHAGYVARIANVRTLRACMRHRTLARDTDASSAAQRRRREQRALLDALREELEGAQAALHRKPDPSLNYQLERDEMKRLVASAEADAAHRDALAEQRHLAAAEARMGEIALAARTSAERNAAERVAAKNRVEHLSLETLSLSKVLRERESGVRALERRRAALGDATRATHALGALYAAKSRALRDERTVEAEQKVGELLLHGLAAPGVSAVDFTPPGLPRRDVDERGRGREAKARSRRPQQREGATTATTRLSGGRGVGGAKTADARAPRRRLDNFAARVRRKGGTTWAAAIADATREERGAQDSAHTRARASLTQNVGEIERNFRAECTAALRDVTAQRCAVERAASDTATQLSNATRAIDAVLPQWARYKQDAAQSTRASDARHSAFLERRDGVAALWRELAIAPDQQRATLRAEFDAVRLVPAQRSADVLAALGAETRALHAAAALAPAIAERERAALHLSALQTQGAECGAQALTKEALDALAVEVWEANNQLGSLDAALREELAAFRAAHGRAPRYRGADFSIAPPAGAALALTNGAVQTGGTAGRATTTPL